MEFLGGNGKGAPKLKDYLSTASIGRAEALYIECLAMVRTMWHCGKLVHGDLSEYNVLVLEKSPWIIDVAQAVETMHPQAMEFLNRDLKNLATPFAKAGVACPSLDS